MSQNLNDQDRKKILSSMKIENPENNYNENIVKTDESSEDVVSANDLTANNEDYRTGRWHPSEHFRFIKGCLQHGNNWKKVINQFHN